jgi:S1-C subfamily serine protease
MGDPERDDHGDAAEDPGDALRGWIDPQDRLWRHPSELAAGPLLAAAPPARSARHSRAMLLVGAAAALAAVAWVIVLLSPASDRPPEASGTNGSADSPLTTLAASTEGVPAVAGPASHAMVQLRANTSHGTVSMVGVAVAEGGLVATTADGLSGLRSLNMVGADGRELRSSVVAVDPTSDLALIDVPDDVPVAPFADDATLGAGSGDLTLSMSDLTGATPALHCTPGTVSALNTAIPSGPADGMPGITTSVPALPVQSGDPLLNAQGAVIGILYRSGTTGAATFLPTNLVLGVADDLRSSGRVDHGWLGVEGGNASGTPGALVAALMSGSPAAGRLHAGEVIEALDATPIRTMADLRARLYVLPPHTTVALTVGDGASIQVVDVTLSSSP